MSRDPSNQLGRPPGERAQHVALRDIGQLQRLTEGDPRIRVAILDGPVDVAHPDFCQSRLTVLGGAYAETRDCSTHGVAGAHGTHVCSVILGSEGIAPRCDGLIIPIYDESGDGSVRPASQETLAFAIHQAVDAGAHLINISGGEQVPGGTARHDLVMAVERCQRDNVLIVAAAGNDGCACLHVPGALPSVLAVAAADAQRRPLPSSNWGGPYQLQGILAPGHNIPGALPRGGRGRASGSSYATAVASGVAALMLSAQVERGLPADPRATRRAILSTVSPCDPRVTEHCHRHLVGHLNPRAAMSLVTQGEILMTTTSVQEQTGTVTKGPASETVPLVESPRSIAPGPLTETSVGVEPSDCGCGGGTGAQDSSHSHLAYVLGQIDTDFGTLENYDWFRQNARIGGQSIDPNIPDQLLSYLDENPEFASSLTWTVTVAGVPVYAIEPEDRFCEAVYKRLRIFLASQLRSQLEGEVAISSLPARIGGSTRLLNGAVVPSLVPDPRGMFNFTKSGILENLKALLGLDQEPSRAHQAHVHSYLNFIVDKLRNLGTSADDRAVNYLVIQGYLAMFHRSVLEAPDLPENFSSYRPLNVHVTRNAFCQPGGDCRDVSLTLFNPDNSINEAPVVIRQTVDVAAVNPVLLGQPAIFRIR